MSPDAPDGPETFQSPPRTVRDDDGRSIDLRAGRADDREALVSMYADFHPEDRAQGIPPGTEADVRDWLETVLGEGSLDLVAVHDGELIGHGMLVPDGEASYEVALFVLRSYQGAGIGTELLGTMLGHARDRGIGRVWLTVERWNDAALAVYRKVGFEQIGSASFEIEMAMRLDGEDGL